MRKWSSFQWKSENSNWNMIYLQLNISFTIKVDMGIISPWFFNYELKRTNSIYSQINFISIFFILTVVFLVNFQSLSLILPPTKDI